ncbi:hypothetical protein PFISCL1PPCAC_25865, partial [Pristionchus fissidentatus]
LPLLPLLLLFDLPLSFLLFPSLSLLKSKSLQALSTCPINYGSILLIVLLDHFYSNRLLYDHLASVRVVVGGVGSLLNLVQQFLRNARWRHVHYLVLHVFRTCLENRRLNMRRGRFGSALHRVHNRRQVIMVVQRLGGVRGVRRGALIDKRRRRRGGGGRISGRRGVVRLEMQREHGRLVRITIKSLRMHRFDVRNHL